MLRSPVSGCITCAGKSDSTLSVRPFSFVFRQETEAQLKGGSPAMRDVDRALQLLRKHAHELESERLCGTPILAYREAFPVVCKGQAYPLLRVLPQPDGDLSR